ncbi:MAG: hypothetical protein JWL82_275 [Parcubacteria group bacterium]|nr:hypothetical protein [Parcubacteria group bacterium]
MSAERRPLRKEHPMAQPIQVQQARINGDTAALSAMGSKGAEVTNRIRSSIRAEDEMLAMVRAREESERKHQTGEDVIPLDTYN